MKINSKKTLIISVIVFMLLFRIWQTSGCTTYTNYSWSTTDVISDVESQRNYEDNPNSITAKLLHNKFFSFAHISLLSVANYYEPRYLLNILGPLGLYLVLLGIGTIIKKNSKLGLAHISAIIGVSLMIMLVQPNARHFIFALSLESLSLWSINLLTKSKNAFVILLLLFPLTIWFFMVEWKLSQICSEILFK